MLLNFLVALWSETRADTYTVHEQSLTEEGGSATKPHFHSHLFGTSLTRNETCHYLSAPNKWDDVISRVNNEPPPRMRTSVLEILK